MDSIFSGESGKELWDKLWHVHDKDTSDTLYVMGNKCQELESLVREQGKVIKELQDALQALKDNQG